MKSSLNRCSSPAPDENRWSSVESREGPTGLMEIEGHWKGWVEI